MFPPYREKSSSSITTSEFNAWNFWKPEVPELDESLMGVFFAHLLLSFLGFLVAGTIMLLPVTHPLSLERECGHTEFLGDKERERVLSPKGKQ